MGEFMLFKLYLSKVGFLNCISVRLVSFEERILRDTTSNKVNIPLDPQSRKKLFLSLKIPNALFIF